MGIRRTVEGRGRKANTYMHGTCIYSGCVYVNVIDFYLESVRQLSPMGWYIVAVMCKLKFRLVYSFSTYICTVAK